MSGADGRSAPAVIHADLVPFTELHALPSSLLLTPVPDGRPGVDAIGHGRLLCSLEPPSGADP